MHKIAVLTKAGLYLSSAIDTRPTMPSVSEEGELLDGRSFLLSNTCGVQPLLNPFPRYVFAG